MIKTVNLANTELEVKFDTTHTRHWIQNLSDADVLASLSEGIIDGKDGVLTITPGGISRLRSDTGVKNIYLLGIGKVQIIPTDNDLCPSFKSALGGGDGSGGDYVPLSGGTMEGALIAQSNADYEVAQMRNVIISADEPSGTAPEGTIWYQYEVTE